MNNVNNILLQNAIEIARERKMELEDVLQALSDSIKKVLENKYIDDYHLFKISFDTKGKFEVLKKLIAKQEVKDFEREILLSIAHITYPSLKEGEEQYYLFSIEENFNRNDFFMLQKILSSNLKKQKKQRELENFQYRVNTIAEGKIKHIQHNQDVIVDVEGTECLMFANKCLASDRISYGQRMYVFIYKVQPSEEGFQVFVSRTSPHLVEEIIKREVPDFNRKVEIKAIARLPGVKTKVAVTALDPSIDPSAYCIGAHGVIAQNISKQLGTNEKVFFINWNENPFDLLQNALKPIQIIDVVQEENLYVIVPDMEFEVNDKGDYIIKRRTKVDVILAGALVKTKIILVPVSQYDRNKNIITSRRNIIINLIDQLNVDESIAELLANNNYSSGWKLAHCSKEDLMERIPDFDEILAQEIISRANDFVEENTERYKEEFLSLGGEEDLFYFEMLSAPDSVKLADRGILTVKKLSDSSIEEIYNILGMDKGDIITLITHANNYFKNNNSDNENENIE